MAKDNQDESSDDQRKTPSRLTGPGLMVPLMIVAIIAGYLFIYATQPRKIRFDVFKKQLEVKNVDEVELFTRYAVGKLKRPLAIAPESKSTEATDQASESKSPADHKSSESKSTEKGKEAKAADLMFRATLPDRI